MDPTLIIYLLTALISYLGAKKAGLSNGKAALVAAGTTGLAYKYDLAGKLTGLFGGGADPVLDGGLTDVPADAVPADGVMDKIGDWISDNSSTIGKLVVSGGVAAGAGSVLGSDNFKKAFPWILGALGLVFILK